MTTRGTLRPLSIAPMMDRTDRHQRRVMRALTQHTLLYTEMVTTGAVLHGDRARLLGFDPAEHPIALQLGGDDPQALAACARIAQERGYDEVNLNVGCPSDRVQQGAFGAVLMKQPERVAQAVVAMREAVAIPVTVKHRIGVDELDRYEDLRRFVDVVAEAGCDRFTVHARKAWLKGLSPKQNRNVPPLRYPDVARLKAERPDLHVEINGGIRSLDLAEELLGQVDAVMIGRAAVDNPYLFAEADQRFFGSNRPVISRVEAVRSVYPYVRAWQGRPFHKLHHITRHLLNLFVGVPGTKAYKRALSEAGPQAGVEAIEGALQAVLGSTAKASAG